MTKEKAEKIIRIYNWVRFIFLVILLLFIFIGVGQAQTNDFTRSQLQQKMAPSEERALYVPSLHGILRGKYEYQPDLNAGRFEVRNARLSASGKLPLRSEYKLEVDLCDETAIKMKDAWVRLCPWRTLRLTVGQQRMPFSIDAHRDPAAQYFANRSFIAKQVGDVRDVGFEVGYDIIHEGQRALLTMDGGIFNGSNLDNQKTAWFQSPAYSVRIQYFPVKGLTIIPSIQHQIIAERQASYTSFDAGAFYETRGWHMGAEFLHKSYADNAFSDCNAVDAMIIYKQIIRKEHSYIQHISYQGRYDYMQDHSSGQQGFVADATGIPTSVLALTDAERHRMTLGVTLGLRNPYFPTDLRFNYEKYWYPHGGAKESEQDKLVCELVIRF